MKALLWTVFALVLAGGCIYAVGTLLPVRHTARETLTLRSSPLEVWQVISDFAGYASWRTGVVGVERKPDLNGHPVWHEVEKGGGGLQFETLAVEEGVRLVRRIAGEGLPFGGTWTFSLAPHEGNGTELTITEDGEIYNPVFRFVARYVMGYQRSMKTYMSDLTGRLGLSAICTTKIGTT